MTTTEKKEKIEQLKSALKTVNSTPAKYINEMMSKKSLDALFSDDGTELDFGKDSTYILQYKSGQVDTKKQLQAKIKYEIEIYESHKVEDDIEGIDEPIYWNDETEMFDITPRQMLADMWDEEMGKLAHLKKK
jgi:hypothetical protein